MDLTVTAHNYYPSEKQVDVVAAPPDMAVFSADVSASGAGGVIRAGETVTIKAVVYNLGGLSASSVLVEFYDGDPAKGGNKIGSTIIPDIPAHRNATAQITWVAASGPKAVFAVADPAGAIAELDEGNNGGSAPVTISGVDLTIAPEDITFSPTILYGGMPAAATGTVVTINATVHNLGTDAAVNAYIRFYDGNPLTNGILIGGDKRIERVNASGTGVASVVWNNTAAFGTRIIFVLVNPAGSVGHQVEYDETNNNASASIALNAPPVFNEAIGPQSTNEDKNLNSFLDVSAYVSDPDDELTALVFRIISSTEPEANVSLTSLGMLSIRPDPDWSGMTVVTVGVSDGISEAAISFNFTVVPVNDPPVLDPMPENLTLQAGSLYVFNVTAHDPDLDYGDVLTFAADTNIFSINKSSGKILYTPTAAQAGKQSIRITVTDKEGTMAAVYWKFTVVKPNTAPTLVLGDNLTILGMETKPLYYKFNATDADNDAITFSVDTGIFAINANTGEVSFSPARGTAGTYRYNLTARDPGGLSDTRTVTLVIARLPAPGNGGSDFTMLYVILALVAAMCLVAAAFIARRIRGRKGGRIDGSEKERYEALYGAGTYDYAQKSGSSSLGEFREAEKQGAQVEPLTCPKCGSHSIQSFPDGGAICNKCGNTVK
jgi:hypothetical protein